MEGSSKNNRRQGKKPASDEAPTGDVILRNSAFTDLPPTIFFGRESMPPDSFKPKTLPYNPVALYRTSTYSIFRDVLRDNGFTLTYKDSGDFLVNWSTYRNGRMYMRVKPYQKYNHFAGAWRIARKANLSKYISQANQRHPGVFDFHSETYLYPSEYSQIKEMIKRENKILEEAGATHKAFFISKPFANSRGRGITFVQDVEDPSTLVGDKIPNKIIQKYIPNPLLVKGKKFDLRIHVLVTSLSPLRVYVHRDGIVRMTSKQYVPVEVDSDVNIHLTNAALAIASGIFVSTEEPEGDPDSSEMTLPHLIRYIKEEQQNPNSINNYKNVDADKIWPDILEVTKKTLVAEKYPLMKEVKELQVNTLEMEEECSPIPSKLDPSNFSKGLKQTENGKRLKTGDYVALDISGNTDDGESPTEPNANPFHIEGDMFNKEIMGCDGDDPVCPPREKYFHDTYDSCFELYGFDFLIDDNGKVWLIEVNIGPMQEIHSVLDKVVKTNMASGLFNIVGLNKYCGERYESAVTGRRLTARDVAEEKLKLSVDEFYRSLGTRWARAFPDNNLETLELFEREDPLDRMLLNWCLNPSFEGSLASATHGAREALVENERQMTSHPDPSVAHEIR